MLFGWYSSRQPHFDYLAAVVCLRAQNFLQHFEKPGRTFVSFIRFATFVCALVFLQGASAKAVNFGAIAYAPATGAYGQSYDYGSRRQAENRAMLECRARSAGCRIAVWFRNACGAVASGPFGWGQGWGNSRARAQYEALASCSRHTGGCGIRAWACTTR